MGYALASRVEVRDYADTARILDRYSPAQLIGFAHHLDPGLTAEDFADAGRQLDRIADEEFPRDGLSHQDVSVLRGKFAAWPRTPQAVSRAAAASGLPIPALSRNTHPRRQGRTGSLASNTPTIKPSDTRIFLACRDMIATSGRPAARAEGASGPLSV
jgi:hypothetical protein